ncbi:DUF4198 domain-containing protein [Persephonella sp.]
MVNLILSWLLFFTLSVYALGHELWVEKEDEHFILFFGHNSSIYNDRNVVEYDPKRVSSVICVYRDGSVREIIPERNYPVKVKSSCSVVYFLLAPEYWTKTPYGTVKKDKTKVTYPINSWISKEGVKRIEIWNNNLKKSFNKYLDIIPLNNPFAIHKGEKLEIMVTFSGKPVKGVAVAYDGRFRGMTDKEGKISISILHEGLQSIEATYKVKLKSETADEILYSMTLNFDLH